MLRVWAIYIKTVEPSLSFFSNVDASTRCEPAFISNLMLRYCDDDFKNQNQVTQWRYIALYVKFYKISGI